MKDIWNNKKFYISKKAWIYLIVVEILILIAAGFFYSRRESVMLNFSQEELVNDAGDNVFYLVGLRNRKCDNTGVHAYEGHVYAGSTD